MDRLEAEFEAELEADQPTAARDCAAWAEQSGLRADTAMIEEILAMPWKPQAQQGFFALLAALGIADPESES